MDIGSIPLKEDKVSAIPLNLFYVEYTAYSQFQKDFFLLEIPKKLLPAIFEKNACQTTYLHYAVEFTPVKPNEEILNSDAYLVTYLMYNEAYVYFARTSDPIEAWEEAKLNIHVGIEKVILNRYRLVKEWRKEFVQPFAMELKYFSEIYLKK